MSRRQVLIALAATLALGVGLRAYRLSDASLWFDEAVSYTTIERFSWPEMIERTAQAVHPPFYYIALRLWASVFGASIESLRTFSVVLSGLTMVGLYLFCRDAFADPEAGSDGGEQGRAIGVTAAALLAVSSAHLVWAQQARMYMLGTALAAFSTWMLVRALRAERGAGRWWFGYALTAAAFLYTHNYALFSVFAQALFVCGVLACREGRCTNRMLRSRRTWSAAAAFLAVGVLYLPWAPVLLGQADRVQQDYWIHPMHGWTVPNAWLELFVPRNAPPAKGDPGAVVACGAVIAVLVGCLIKGRRADWLVVSMVVVPVACAVVVSLGGASIILARYFLFAQLFTLCAIARLLWHPFPGEIRAAVLAGLLLNAGYVHLQYWQELGVAGKTGLKGAVRHVLERRSPDEPVVVVHPAIYHAARYHARGAAAPKLFLPSELSHYNGGPLLTEDDVLSPEELRNAPFERIWVLDTTGFSETFVRFSMPAEWRAVSGSRAAFREVHYFQREVTAALFERSTQAVNR